MSGQTATIGADIVNASNGNDGIVVEKCLATLPGGTTLDVSGFSGDVIQAGHVIVKTTSTGICKPLGITDNAYDSIANGEEAVGVLKASVLASKPLASVVTIGQVNAAASPYTVTSAIISALPHILFI